ncbi:hypothetical protein PYCC9005_005450 [Savitreella phatthalungensis]
MLGQVRRIEDDLRRESIDEDGSLEDDGEHDRLLPPSRKHDASLILADGRRVRRFISLSRLSFMSQREDPTEDHPFDLTKYLDRRCAKSVIAYVLASLLVLLPPVGALFPGDGKHFAATCCVYFFPARSVGHMVETVVLALSAMVFAVVVSIGSAWTAVACNAAKRPVLGHTIVLVFWLAGGVAILARWKELRRNPTVGVATSMSSIIFFTNITREGSARQTDLLQLDKVLAYVAVVLIGLIISFVVSLTIWPQYATESLRSQLSSAPEQLGRTLVLVTRSFLGSIEKNVAADSALERDVSAAFTRLHELLPALRRSLHEASFELRCAGRPEELTLFTQLIDTVCTLVDGLEALRASCDAQRHLLIHDGDEDFHATAHSIAREYMLRLGPVMKSVVYTARHATRDMADNGATIGALQFSNVHRALDLFKDASAHALSDVYRQPIFSQLALQQELAACEEVAASVDYFSTSLVHFITSLGQCMMLFDELRESSKGVVSRRALMRGLLSVMTSSPPYRPRLPRIRPSENLSHRVWRALSYLKRPEIKFAIKAGTGAALFALPSMIPWTRPFYVEWRLEWGLLSFFIVLNTSVGATYSAAWWRVVGSFLGTLLALGAWTLARGHSPVLIVIGALVATVCLPLILNPTIFNAPFGRFILLSYNLTALYAYTLSISGDDVDEGGKDPRIAVIAIHRTVSVTLGCLWGALFNAYVAPTKARTSLRRGISAVLLDFAAKWRPDRADDSGERLGYGRGDGHRYGSGNGDVPSIAELRVFLAQCPGEPRLRGTFPSEIFRELLDHLDRLCGAARVLETRGLPLLGARVAGVIKQPQEDLADALFLYGYMLGTAVWMRLGLPESLPAAAAHARERLLARLADYRLDRIARGCDPAASSSKTSTRTSPDRHLHPSDNLNDQDQTHDHISGTPFDEADYRPAFVHTLITGAIVRELDAVACLIRQL